MRHQVFLSGTLLSAIALTACSIESQVAPVDAVARVVPAGAQVAAVVAPQPRITTVSVGTAQDEGGPEGQAIAGAPALPVGDVPEALNLDTFSRTTRALDGEAKTSSILDPWRPEFVGIVNRTGTSVTLAWHTTANTRGAVYFGRSLFLRWAGYNQARYVSESRNNHQFTIQGLSRFTSYTFAVVGLDPILQTQYPAPPVRIRTNLF